MITAKPLLPRVVNVQPLDDFLLKVKFKDDSVKLFDVKPYLKYPAFQRLNNSSFFSQAHVEHGTVVWDDMLDLSPDSLYLDGAICDADA